MDKLIEAVGPVLIASIALQQLLELLDPVLDALLRKQKKWILSAVALIVGLILSFGLGLRLLAPLGFAQYTVLDGIVTALFLTGGTKAVNDLLKWVGYMKESAKRGMSEEEKRQV